MSNSISIVLPNGNTSTVAVESSNTVSVALPKEYTLTTVVDPTTSVSVSTGVFVSADKNEIKGFSNLAWVASGSEWVMTVTHSLNKFPAVQVFDSLENLVHPDVTRINDSNIKLTSKSVFSGKVVLN